MKKLQRITSSILLLSLLYACFDTTQKEENISVDKDFNIVKINNEYKIGIPKYMKEAKDLNDEASLQYQNIFKETYIVIIDEPIDEFVDVFKELGEYDSTLSVVENYRDVQTQFISESFQINKKSASESLKINGLDAQMMELEGTFENIDIFYNLAFVQSKEKLYMIMTWTLKNRKNKYKKTFEAMIKSFGLLGNE
jgi:hypothetical protein